MAKEKKGKTKAQLATEAARAVVKAAKAKLAKQDTDANKKAVADAKAKVAECVGLENRERFETLGALRVGKVLLAMDTFSNSANTRGYRYTKEDIEDAFTVMGDKLKSIRQMFDAGLATASDDDTPGEGAPVFSFKKKTA